METNIYTCFIVPASTFRKYMTLLGIVFLLIIALPVRAQQEPGYSQFMYNKLPINPAYAGGREMLSVRMLYRDQWTQLEGHPRTLSLSVNGPLYNENIALGVGLVYDQIGVTITSRVNTVYAYRIKLNPGGKQNIKLSLGLNAGILLYKADLSQIDPVDNNDPTFSEDISKILPDLGAGFYLFGTNFYVGASVPNFLTLSLNDASQQDLPDNISARRVPHIFTMAGGVVPLGKSGNIKLRPQMMVKCIAGKEYKAPVVIDANLSILMFDKVNTGVTYRTAAGKNKYERTASLARTESIDFMLELWPIRSLLIGYTFDYTLSELKNNQKGTHEVVLGYDLKPLKKKGTAIGCYHF